MKTSDVKKTILVIDDDKVFAMAVHDFLTGDDVQVLLAHKAADGLTLCSLHKVDVVLLDQRLPDAEGNTLCPDILKYNDQTKIIFATAFPSFDNAVKAIRAGAFDYLSKPFDLGELSLAVKQAFRTLELEQVEQVHDYERALDSKGNIVIGGRAFAETMQLVELAAASDSPVLITGETGTGKSLAAKAIHYKSRHQKGPFIGINCAALPETLIEAELFGYEKGAYTGAVSSKKGLFEVAEGGTLFLDEIGEMPMHLQSKLLSAIEEKTIRKIGGTVSKPISVRIMAATGVDLEQMLGKTFRKDLYYRLGVIRIHMPALRDRKEDIPGLCAHLIRTITNRPIEIPNQDLAALMKYDWPGNVRELRNILERALFVQKGNILEPSQLLKKMVSPEKPHSRPGRQPDGIKTLAEGEKELISAALSQLSGNLMQSARALGISVTTLKRKIKEYDLSPSTGRKTTAEMNSSLPLL